MSTFASQRVEEAHFFCVKLTFNFPVEDLKRSISGPYDFHHITHTSSSQFHALDNASNERLVDELSAIQASQMPEPELKGIRAQDLPSTAQRSTEDIHCQSPTSPPLSPVSPRSPKRIENFSRPVPRAQKEYAASPSIAPPRTSSAQVLSDEMPQLTSQAIDEMLGLNVQPSLPDYDYPESLSRTPIVPVDLSRIIYRDPPPVLSEEEEEEEEEDAMHTSAVINSYLSELDDVPEEDETNLDEPTKEPKPASNIEPELQKPAQQEPESQNSGLQSTQEPVPESEPVPSADDQPKSSSPPAAKPIGNQSTGVRESAVIGHFAGPAGSEDLMSPTLPTFQFTAQSPASSDSTAKSPRKRSSAGVMAAEEFSSSWEEVIDYCYEHAAEADCDFDWQRASRDLSRLSVADVHPSPYSEMVSRVSCPVTPELDTGSAETAYTRSREVITPVSAENSKPELFPMSVADKGDYFNKPLPHIYAAGEGDDIGADPMYEEFLSGGEDRVRVYSQDRTPQECYSPLSKCNSQESMILSRAASIVRKHRSSASTTSVPELIPSTQSSRENTIRESIGSLEPPASPDVHRTTYASPHRSGRATAEFTAVMNLRSAHSNGSLHDIMARHGGHDRSQSASAVEQDHVYPIMKNHGPTFAARMRSPTQTQKAKGRTSYSLFPATATGARP